MKPIDINTVYNTIIEKLMASDNTEILTALENSNAGASTGSEALMGQGAYLSGLKNTNPSVFRLIEEQIEMYTGYCRQNGLLLS